MNELQDGNPDGADTGIPQNVADSVGKWGTWIGLMLIALGIISLIAPGLTAMAIEIWLACIFFLVGLGLLVQAYQSRGHGSVTYEVLWGIVYVLAGLVLLVVPKSGIVTLALILGVVFILDGLGRIMFASQAVANDRKMWWILDGVMAVLLGCVILWNWPGGSAWIVGILVGIRLLFSGAITVLVSQLIRQRA